MGKENNYLQANISYENVMDNISEKLGLHDFFNVLIGGVVIVIGGIYIYTTLIDDKFYSQLEVGAKELIFFIIISYVLGIVIQEVGSFFDRYVGHYRKKALQTFLKRDSDIIDNEEKKHIYRKLGKNILENKEIEFQDEYTTGQCEYIYGYCCYYIEVRGKHTKIEKMRALYDMSRTLWSSFVMLLLAYILVAFRINPQLISVKTFSINVVIFAVIIFLLYNKMIKDLRYKIRMTMGVYETLVDLEKEACG